MRALRIGIAAPAVLVIVTTLARADNLALFTGALDDVATHNRLAIEYLGDNKGALAIAEIDRMKQAWSVFAERFGGDRPDRLRDSQLYATALVDVPTRIVTAMIMVNFGRPDIAANSLQAIRQEFSAVRRTAGIDVLADRVLDANGAMDALAEFRRQPPDWDNPDTATDIARKADNYRALIGHCDISAPALVRAAREFRRLVDGIAASLALVRRALADHDTVLLDRAIMELQAFDHWLAFRYG
jgi:hypothetical protein